MSDQPQIIITLMPDGSVQINGPIDNKLLCYGLLECAKDAIREYKQKQKSAIITPPALSLVEH